MEAMVYKNIQEAINFLNINITKWGTKKKGGREYIPETRYTLRPQLHFPRKL